MFLYFCLNIPTGFSVTFVRKCFQVTHISKITHEIKVMARCHSNIIIT